MKFKQFILNEIRTSIEQERIDKEFKYHMKNKKNVTNFSNIEVWVAKIISIYGGNEMVAYSFARNYSDAVQEIKGLPHFKKFMSLPRKQKISL